MASGFSGGFFFVLNQDRFMSAKPHVYRAIRGATTLTADEPALVRDATDELLRELMKRNAL
jgi:Chorismate mutase type I